MDKSEYREKRKEAFQRYLDRYEQLQRLLKFSSPEQLVGRPANVEQVEAALDWLGSRWLIDDLLQKDRQFGQGGVGETTSVLTPPQRKRFREELPAAYSYLAEFILPQLKAKLELHRHERPPYDAKRLPQLSEPESFGQHDIKFVAWALFAKKTTGELEQAFRVGGARTIDLKIATSKEAIFAELQALQSLLDDLEDWRYADGEAFNYFNYAVSEAQAGLTTKPFTAQMPNGKSSTGVDFIDHMDASAPGESLGVRGNVLEKPFLDRDEMEARSKRLETLDIDERFLKRDTEIAILVAEARQLFFLGRPIAFAAIARAILERLAILDGKSESRASLLGWYIENELGNALSNFKSEDEKQVFLKDIKSAAKEINKFGNDVLHANEPLDPIVNAKRMDSCYEHLKVLIIQLLPKLIKRNESNKHS